MAALRWVAYKALHRTDTLHVYIHSLLCSALYAKWLDRESCSALQHWYSIPDDICALSWFILPEIRVLAGLVFHFFIMYAGTAACFSLRSGRKIPVKRNGTGARHGVFTEETGNGRMLGCSFILSVGSPSDPLTQHADSESASQPAKQARTHGGTRSDMGTKAGRGVPEVALTRPRVDGCVKRLHLHG